MEHNPRKAEPGSHIHWPWHLYDSSDMVPYQTMRGTRARVAKHRLYRTPAGNVSAHPYVARMQAKYMKVWLPAVWGKARPPGTRGKWVQLSKLHSNVGLMHATGMETQLVRVLQIASDARGQPRALVRYLREPHMAKRRAPPRAGNPTESIVSTRTGQRARRDRFVRISQPIGERAGGLGCRIFPWMKKCLPTKVCPAGTEPDNQGTCLPSGDRPAPRRRAPVTALPRSPRGARSNPEMSVADDRAKHETSYERLRRTLRNLGSGRARMIVDAKGIKIQEKKVA